MLFNSIEYAVYLMAVFLLYWFCFNRGVRMRNLFIIAVSYFFYGWWDWRFLLLIVLTSVCSYASGIQTGYYLDRNRCRAARWVCGLNIGLNLGILCVFKYCNFFMTEFADIFLDGDTSGLLIKLVLPVGISFYTFQALSYSVDVYRRAIPPTKDLSAFMAYIAFFPQLVAGPIERATNLLSQFEKIHRFDYDRAVDGMRRILWGLFKKVIVADSCAGLVNVIFGNYADLPGSTLLIGGVLFAFQIYGDFSGYSDIAIGTSRLFGFNLMENFRLPYFSRNIAEFWRRWHISLNTWFRDYVYIPMGGNRKGKGKLVRNTFTIFVLSGLWHGANWTYIAWGCYHVILFLPMILTGRHKRTYKGGYVSKVGGMVVTFCLVVIGWILFRSSTITDAWRYLQRMCGNTFFDKPTGYGSEHDLWVAIIMIMVMLVIEWIQRNREHGLAIGTVRPRLLRWTVYYAILIGLLFSKGVETFIYFQF